MLEPPSAARQSEWRDCGLFFDEQFSLIPRGFTHRVSIWWLVGTFLTRRKLQLFYLSLLNGNELMRCYGFLPRIIRNEVLCFKFLFLIFPFLTSWSDIDECSSSKGGCSHTCHNSAGSFTCSCPTGLELDPGKRSCKGKIGISNFHPLFVATVHVFIRLYF